MVETDPILFKFVERGNTVAVDGVTRSYSVPSAWFKNIKTGHKKHGLQFIFPLKHPDYSDDIQETLLTLDPGDTLWMQLAPMNDQHTAWRVSGIAEDNTTEL